LGIPPALELEGEVALQHTLIELINAGLLDSAHDCSDGGLATALAKMAFPTAIGCSVDLPSNELAPEFVLFGEDASRVVISCDPANLARIKQIAAKHSVSAEVLGETVIGTIEIKVDGQALVSARIAELQDGYENALEQALRSEPAQVVAD